MKRKIGIGLIVLACVIAVFEAVVVISGALKATASVSIIGGADGPTTVFVVGKLFGGFQSVIFLIAAILAIIGVVLVKRKS